MYLKQIKSNKNCKSTVSNVNISFQFSILISNHLLATDFNFNFKISVPNNTDTYLTDNRKYISSNRFSTIFSTVISTITQLTI